MKRFLYVMVSVAALGTQAFAADVGVSVSIGQPGFYGRIDIGGYPPPVVVYDQPRYIERVPVGRPPIYLRVPPGHIKHWGKHCREYNACGEAVYFVRDDWYSREYVPRYQERRGDFREDNHGQNRDAYRGDEGRNNRGHGKGHGHDNERNH